MNKQQKCISLKLVKLLAENGFKGESEFYYREWEDGRVCLDYFGKDNIKETGRNEKLKFVGFFPAYDILNDLCIKYPKEIFGEKGGECTCGEYSRQGGHICGCEALIVAWQIFPKKILLLLQQNRKEEAEEYIWKHSILNK